MRYQFLFLLAVMGAAPCAQAGPWLREKGTSFSAVSLTTTYYLETTSQTYLEHGLSDATTLIADIGMARFHYAPHTGYATLSMRRALSAADATSKWAYELGVGAGWIGTQTLPHVRAALSWGRGMTWGETSGWMTVDGAVIWDLRHGLHVTKLDTTVGMNFTDSTKGMLQLYTAHAAGQSFGSIAPSVVYQPAATKFSIQVGAESPLGDWGNSAIKIGLWRSF